MCVFGTIVSHEISLFFGCLIVWVTSGDCFEQTLEIIVPVALRIRLYLVDAYPF